MANALLAWHLLARCAPDLQAEAAELTLVMQRNMQKFLRKHQGKGSVQDWAAEYAQELGGADRPPTRVVRKEIPRYHCWLEMEVPTRIKCLPTHTPYRTKYRPEGASSDQKP